MISAIVFCYLDLKEKNDYLEFSQHFDIQTEKEDKSVYSLLGFDIRGQVQFTTNGILRTTCESYLDIAKKTFEKYKNFAKDHSDIVETKMEGFNFIHKRYITTYPHEWTANMIKDAILFDLNLALKLRKYGLIVVDFSLRNNVFNCTQPIYVDFYGIITDEAFKNKTTSFLFENENISKIFNLKQQEFEGSLIVIKSFILLANGQNNLARKMLMIPHKNPAIVNEKVEDRWGLLKELYSKNPSTEIYESLMKLIESISVGLNPRPHQYPFTYYADKHENFDYDNRTNWLPKQNSVYKILNKYKPETVIDIGCNTGWFSILSEHLGSKVVSIDADEAVIDNLYLYGKEHKLNILPLKISFENLDKKYIYKKYPSPDWKEYSTWKELYAAPILRLKSEMTLCLALVHHLVLAHGMNIEKVMNILARITNKVLVLEVPDLQDKLITRDLSYYRYAKNATSDQYSTGRFIEEGLKYFKKVEIYPSHPKTRKIIVFEK